MKIIKGLAAFVAVTAAQIVVLIAMLLLGMAAGAAWFGEGVAPGVGLAFMIGGWALSEWALRRTPLAFLRVSQNPIFHWNV